MLGIILLLISLILYFKPKYRYISYFFYLSFMLGYDGGFGLWTDTILGIKNNDLAIIFTFVISTYLLLQNKYQLPQYRFIKWYKLFLIFMFCSILFSYIHYDFSLYQILQGGRSYLLLFALPILIKIRPYEIIKLLRLLLYVTIITSILYILQIIVGRPLMPYNGEPNIDTSTGLIRMYNSPALLTFFLIFTFVKPKFFGKKVILLKIIFFIALVCTLGRTGIFSNIISILLAMAFLGKTSKLIKTLLIIGILFIPFIGIVTSRFEKGGTSDDLSAIKTGNFQNYNMGEDGTMTYRIAWIYERLEYLMHRPIGEQIFGLGLISDSQPIVQKKYKFRLGLTDTETHMPVQLSTPDIAYGNILSKLGICGGIIYLILLVSIASFLYKNRKKNPLVLICAAQIIILFIGSFASSALSYPNSLIMHFIAIGTLCYMDKNKFCKINNK